MCSGNICCYQITPCIVALMNSKPRVGPDLLQEVIQTITGPRQKDYGHPEDNLGCTAELMQAYLQGAARARGHTNLEGYDVAVLMILVKVARLAESPKHKDSWLDIAGYVACGWDCVGAEPVIAKGWTAVEQGRLEAGVLKGYAELKDQGGP